MSIIRDIKTYSFFHRRVHEEDANVNNLYNQTNRVNCCDKNAVFLDKRQAIEGPQCTI